MSVGNQIATLNIRMAMPEDSGQYTMLAENAAGENDLMQRKSS